MSAPVAFDLFRQLCDVGNYLEQLRDAYQPASDKWLWHTDVLALLDSCIDMLANSNGIDDEDDDEAWGNDL